MDGTQAKVWKCLGPEAIDMVWDLMWNLMQRIYTQDKIPMQWRDSLIVHKETIMI